MRPIAIFVFSLLFIISQSRTVHAQSAIMNMPEHDQKAYYFGITFAMNISQYRIRYTDAFAHTDTFMQVQSNRSPGFNLGLMGNLRLSNFIDIRTTPSIAFAEKKMRFNHPNTDSIVNRSIESIYLHLPLQFKFKSDRIGNFRFYGIAGGKLDFDMASNARSRRADEFLKVKPLDLGLELGVGFEFYYPNFIFAPEIKLSQGLMNQLHRDPNLQLTNAIDQINTRMIVISIHLQG